MNTSHNQSTAVHDVKNLAASGHAAYTTVVGRVPRPGVLIYDALYWNRAMCSLLVALLLISTAFGFDVNRYAWEFPNATDIPQPSTENLRSQLLEQIDDILAAGNLTPWRVNHADEYTDAYFVYFEPGRIVTTLAWAYPHLSESRQKAVKDYVHLQFDSKNLTPWNTERLSADMPGTRREFHPINRVGNWTTNWQPTRPTVQTLYGAWLWAYRANDFESIRPHWGEIKACYQAKLSQGDIFSTMSAHIAMLRLAEVFADQAMLDASWLNLSNNLQMGLSFDGDPNIQADPKKMSQIEKNTLRMYLSNNNGGLYWPKQNGTIYRGMMFFGISPEIGRYLAENVKDQTLRRNSYGKERFPLWWMVDAPYFQRDYTGDEGVGLVQPEMMGMLFPVERWVVETKPEILTTYLASAPSCRGDCVWIESLVQTLESFGRTEWRDVRNKNQMAKP